MTERMERHLSCKIGDNRAWLSYFLTNWRGHLKYLILSVDNVQRILNKFVGNRKEYICITIPFFQKR